MTEKEREEEVERRKERARRKQRRSAILENEVNRPGTTSEEDKRWWKETFEDEMEKAIERARCADYEDKVKERAKSLPADSNAKGEELVNLALYPPFRASGVVEDGCNAAIGFFEQQDSLSQPEQRSTRFVPHSDAFARGECVVSSAPSPPAPGRHRTRRRTLAAICWSVTFPERFDVAIKNRLKEKNYVALAIVPSDAPNRLERDVARNESRREDGSPIVDCVALRSEVKSTPAAPHRARIRDRAAYAAA